MEVARIFIYPVKSLRGCEVAAAEWDPLGLAGDRRFLVVDETGRFLTQRALPQMARISTALSADRLILAVDGFGEISIPRSASERPASLRTVNIWKDDGLLAEDCGEDVAGWLSQLLGRVCRLVRVGPAFRRPIREERTPGPLAGASRQVAFNDATPILLATEASLDDLNARLVERGEDPVPMNRFRPNLVLGGGAPFAEDGWTALKIGGTRLLSAGPCARCVMTTTDQLTGERFLEPLRTLAEYRRDPKDPNKVNFGQNFVHECSGGTVKVGAAVVPS